MRFWGGAGRVRGRAAALVLVLAAGVSGGAGAEEGGVVSSYLVPQTIFVGDRGRLVAALGAEFQGAAAFVVTAAQGLPATEDYAITRLALEKRGGEAWLLVDFIPYRSGRLEFPPLPVPGEGGPREVAGLAVEVASILEAGADGGLSPAAAPLEAPGTAFLVYGAGALLVVLALAAVTGGLWARGRLRGLDRLAVWLRRRSLFRSLRRFLRRLRAEADRGGRSPAELFDLLEREFREFLSFYTGSDCRVLTPGEFFALFPGVPDAPFRELPGKNRESPENRGGLPGKRRGLPENLGESREKNRGSRKNFREPREDFRGLPENLGESREKFPESRKKFPGASEASHAPTAEFQDSPEQSPAARDMSRDAAEKPLGLALERMLRGWEKVRFGGGEVSGRRLVTALEEVEDFVCQVERGQGRAA